MNTRKQENKQNKTCQGGKDNPGPGKQHPRKTDPAGKKRQEKDGGQQQLPAVLDRGKLGTDLFFMFCYLLGKHFHHARNKQEEKKAPHSRPSPEYGRGGQETKGQDAPWISNFLLSHPSDFLRDHQR